MDTSKAGAQAVAEAQAAKDAELLKALQAKTQVMESLQLITPNREQRRALGRGRPESRAMSSSIARCRRKVRRRMEKRSRARNRA